MSRRPASVTSGGVSHVPIHPPLGPSSRTYAIYGHDRPSSPEGMRNLTAGEQAVNEVWTWDPQRGTYVCPAYPDGLS